MQREPRRPSVIPSHADADHHIMPARAVAAYHAESVLRAVTGELAARWERTAGVLAQELSRHTAAVGRPIQQSVLDELNAAHVQEQHLKVRRGTGLPGTGLPAAASLFARPRLQPTVRLLGQGLCSLGPHVCLMRAGQGQALLQSPVRAWVGARAGEAGGRRPAGRAAAARHPGP